MTRSIRRTLGCMEDPAACSKKGEAWTIREVLEKKVRYRGRNELEATAKAEADYYAEKIVLGADDFSYRDISAKELVPVKERRNSR